MLTLLAQSRKRVPGFKGSSERLKNYFRLIYLTSVGDMNKEQFQTDRINTSFILNSILLFRVVPNGQFVLIPLYKGGLRGIIKCLHYKSPLPPFKKGGIWDSIYSAT